MFLGQFSSGFLASSSHYHATMTGVHVSLFEKGAEWLVRCDLCLVTDEKVVENDNSLVEEKCLEWGTLCDI